MKSSSQAGPVNSRVRWLVILLASCCVSGCGSAEQSVPGGTLGILKFGTKVTDKIVLTVYRQNGASFDLAGSGTTVTDGSFTLYTPGAAGPLWLEPGDYAFTLESIGPPVQFPREYSDPKATPLKIRWTPDSATINLEAPGKLIGP